MVPLLLLLVLGTACNSCNPGLPTVPNNDLDDDGSDDGGGLEDGGLADGGDTGTAPACDFPEVEPNLLTSPQAIPMETWVCGDFGEAGDGDFFTTEIPDGWAQIWVRAAELGSQADVQLIISDEDTDYTALINDAYGTTDPLMTFLLDHDRDFLIQLRDTYDQNGDGYTWQMMVSSIKAPIEWDDEEVEPNDSKLAPEPIASGVATFGMLSEADDEDWYTVSIPDGGATLNVRVDGYMLGSVAETRVSIYKPDGKYLSGSQGGETVYEKDPRWEEALDEGGDWVVKVNYRPSSTAQGSLAAWYVLTVTVSTDDGSRDSGG